MVFSKEVVTSYNHLNLFCRKKLKLSIESSCCNYTTTFDSHNNGKFGKKNLKYISIFYQSTVSHIYIFKTLVIPGEPELLDVNEINTTKISMTIRSHETLRCYNTFTNGVKLQTRIIYQSKWIFNKQHVSFLLT